MSAGQAVDVAADAKPAANFEPNCGNAPGQLFPPGATWNRPILDTPLDPQSRAIIAYLDANHREQRRFQIDFSLVVLEAAPSSPRRPFVPNDAFYETECDSAPVPLPAGGALEGERGYECVSDGDCHLLVVDRPRCRLHEMWRANVHGDVFRGGCQAVWDLGRVYPPSGRGEHCTSADAAGLPMTPLLFTVDEVEQGEIRHALRFIIPNQHIRHLAYVRPATHSTSATRGPPDAPAYGARLRLKSSANIAQLGSAAQVVARALQTYGMFLADGGNITFTAVSDRQEQRRWRQIGLGPHDLKALSWHDFEVVDGGPRLEQAECRRRPISR